ncbi:hypothetical protein QBC47DRAFT_465325 [Echria macrotheca]|uniref:Uncharacterized protein n=1 Tax=Echria macrotheca TaxID=438768 RepID=A0AAJ0B1G3_9PEZI|nr:hypothetical protein QBC47DRAFT_465325 [Echria macrotheca]
MTLVGLSALTGEIQHPQVPLAANATLKGLAGDRLSFSENPFPYHELFAVADSALDGMNSAMFKDGASASGITLTTDHPDLPFRDPDTTAQSKAMANVSMSFLMAREAGPQLLDVTEALVEAVLGDDHPEYNGLKHWLEMPWVHEPASVDSVPGNDLWDDVWDGDFDNNAYNFNATAKAVLKNTRAGGQEEGNWADADTSALLGTAGLSRLQLEVVAASRNGSPRLPQILESLRLSHDANLTVRFLNMTLQALLDRRQAGVCSQPALVTAMVAGECFPREWISPSASDHHYGPPLFHLWSTLCGFLNAREILRRRASHVAGRLQHLVKTDKTLSRQRLDRSAKPWFSVHKKAMHHNHLIDNSLRLQLPVLSHIAAQFQETCRLRDAFANRLAPLYTSQSSWWNLTSVDGRVVVHHVTMPTLQEFALALQNASRRLGERSNYTARAEERWKASYHIGSLWYTSRGPHSPQNWMDVLGFGNKTVALLAKDDRYVPQFRAKYLCLAP